MAKMMEEVAPAVTVIRYKISNEVSALSGNAPTREDAIKQVMRWIGYCAKNDIPVISYCIRMYTFPAWKRGMPAPLPKITDIEQVQVD